MTPLSEHFSLEELTFSEVALRKGLGNAPPAAAVANLTRLCAELLEPARAILAVPLHINSGYRSTGVNIAVGGAPMSAHTFGRAADVVPEGVALQDAFDKLRASDLQFDQMIIECNAWLHLAIAIDGTTPRRDLLVASGSPGRWTYQRPA